jgi:hypothetical protein
MNSKVKRFFRGGDGNVSNMANNTGNIVLIVILIIILIFIGIKFYQSFQNYKNNQPYLIYGNTIANVLKTISGNNLPFPSNQPQGLAISYTFWLYVTDWPTDDSKSACVFYKGSEPSILFSPNSNKPGVHYTDIPKQSPGVFLNHETNSLDITMDTINSTGNANDNNLPLEVFTVTNIPVGQWVHISLVLTNNLMNVYVDGQVKQSHRYESLPLLNYGNLYVNAFKGFNGYLSNLRYFAYAVQPYEIEQMMKQGPAKTACIETGLAPPPVLNQQYWFN